MAHKKKTKSVAVLAALSQREFISVRKKIGELATKADLAHFPTREDLRELKEEVIAEVRNENRKVMRSNDAVITKLDTIIKDHAAHGLTHHRIDTKLDEHDHRLSKLEEAETVGHSKR